MPKIPFLALIIISSILLAGCGAAKNLGRSITGGGAEKSQPKKKKVSLNLAEERYQEAFKSMSSGRYEDALSEYNSLVVQYPFGRVTEQAKLDSLFVLHKLGRNQDAGRVADNFIAQHPTHENVDYAYYMKGVILFPKSKSIIGRRLSGSPLRDASDLLDAHTAFKDFIEKFPENEQVPDATQRMIFLEDAVAQDELRTAKFYEARKAYVAVINRSQYIVETYPRTPTARDALILMRDTYKKMGLPELVQTTQTVIDANQASFVEVETNREEAKANRRKALSLTNALESVRKAAFGTTEEEGSAKTKAVAKAKAPTKNTLRSRTPTKYYPY